MASLASLIHHSTRDGGLHQSHSQTRLFRPAEFDDVPTPSYTPPHTGSSHAHSPEEMSNPLGRSNSGEHASPQPPPAPYHEYLPPSRGQASDGAIPLHSSIEVSVPPTVFIRGAGGDYEPCLLMGEVILNLAEATNIREITAHLVGKAKIHYNDHAVASSRSHSDTVTVLEHEWSFLPGDKRHAHTMKAGRHVFPFQLELDGNVPASLRTMGGNASIVYKIRANATRGAFATNYADAKTFNVVRTFTPEALEYTQTLELENTWPGKVMYSIMIPHRAHAAGTEVPVSVKFTPLAKGVQVKTISTEIKEYVTLTTKGGPVSSTRTVTTAKHEFQDGHAVDVTTRSLLSRTATAPLPPHNALAPRTSRSTGSLPALALAAQQSRESADPAFPPPVPGLSVHAAHPMTPPNGAALTASPAQENAPNATGSNTQAGEEENVDLGAGDGEIDTTFKVLIPAWATPTHSVKPVQISHKIKWCCMLSNLDGHTSELRCALPIHILSSLCAEEAWNATSTTRNLLFGTAEQEEPIIELPSYPEHVRDRIANAAIDSTVVAPLSAYTSPAGSPRMTAMSLPDLAHETSVRFAEPFTSTPSRMSTADESYFPNGAGFADTELLSSLGSAFGGSSASSSHGGSHAQTPIDSRGSSRANSRPTSRVGSRASSPEPHDRSPGPSDSTTTLGSESTSRGGLFHLPLSIKPLTSFNPKGKAKATTPPDGTTPGPSPTGRRRMGGRASTSRPPSPPPHAPHHQLDPLSRVPDYDIASRGFLGGGVVPLTAQAGLPSYDEAERLERSRSETSLTDLARQVEQASLTDRLNAIANGSDPRTRSHNHSHTMAALQMTSSRRS